MASFLTGIGGASGLSPSLGQLSPEKWDRLTKRLGEIENPQVSTTPSPYSLPDGKSGHGKSGHGKSGGTGGHPGGD
jgi:hypothetical protein